ncbi:receptor-type tyrosine-protein phosphatase eta-like isoform X2 [Genypterus blacodes]|uniref:receptor-type tyrosine-protein phosphatase eta-like isoform X2 n=1 Tax=Genypterus blacodes TaxID=154954 RepID=UPI003F76DFED
MMTPSPRSRSLSRWTLLLLYACVQNSQVECDGPGTIGEPTVSQTTSTISLNWTSPAGRVFKYRVEWHSGGAAMSNNTTDTFAVLSDLSPGTTYTITVIAVASDNKTEGAPRVFNSVTRPGTIGEPTVSQTTSTISLNWTSPAGRVFKYRVEWHSGGAAMSNNTTDTFAVLSDLSPGTTYTITVIAVASDNKTEGAPRVFNSVTRPGTIGEPSVSQTTSTISLNWTSPAGRVFKYRVEWHSGGAAMSNNTTDTFAVLSDLSPGTTYTITVIAVASDNKTEGAPRVFNSVTRPGTIGEPSVSQTTSTISLNWTSPAGRVFKYRVEWHSGGAAMSNNTTDTFAVLSDLSPGTTYTITVIAVASDEKTEGAPRVSNSVTKPAVVRDLNITEVTTTSVSLEWNEPEGNATSYIVEWTSERVAVTRDTNETSMTIERLIAGYQYNFTVAAFAGYSNDGQRTLVTTFTKPEKPENITVTSRGHGHLNLSWTLPGGRVDHYEVNISNEELTYLTYNITTAVTAVSFIALNPGRVYGIVVTAAAGPFTSTSDQSSIATVPTPPGSIIINQKTNASLHLAWATPELMDGAPNISYHITYQHEKGRLQSQMSTANNTVINSLFSGTFYNITAVTLGPQNLWSTIIHKSTFTLPNPVLNVKASPRSTESVKVEWSDPLGVLEYYTYRIQTSTAGIAVNTTTVNTNSTIITGLEPGTHYSFIITSVAAPGSVSSEEQAFSYTNPKAVTNTTVVDLNSTAIRLTWVRQNDHKPLYSYLVMALLGTGVVHNVSAETETYTFMDLIPGESYTFNVFTVVGSVRSTVESTSSHTRPATVSDIFAIGTTTDLSVSWRAAVGQVDSLTVLLFRDKHLQRNITDLSATTLNTSFQSLTPGTLYRVEVITKSGTLSDSATVSNATIPTPPGPIMVDSQTTDSITFSWALPEDMELNQYNFSVYSNNQDSLTQNINSITLQNLSSGTAYSISVATVGSNHYQSTVVMTQNYTRPHSVTMLRPTEISTNTVTLVWEQPENKPHYSYMVQVTNGSVYPPGITFNTTYTIRGLHSGSNHTFTVTTQTADGTMATPSTIYSFTQPYSVRGLHAMALNTTAVTLNWARPLEHKDSYTYRVETNGCGFHNKTFGGENAVISELIPGTNCSFCCFVRAVDGTEGASSCTSQYTEPESVQPSVSNQGSNSSILVSWTAPAGNVDQYVIQLNSSTSAFERVLLNPPNTSFLFENLSAGRLYAAMVTTRGGPLNSSSPFILEATFPNPPGPIEILMKTTSSIQMRWGDAPLMEHGSLLYLVTYTPSQGTQHNNTSTTNAHTLTSLLSGTSYNISVASVGPMNLTSDEVHTYMITTRPMSVKSLAALTEEEKVKLSWSKPDEYKESYRYKVTWGSSDQIDRRTETTGELLLQIEQLVPGSSYNFEVTTETSDATLGAPNPISKCTNASPVTGLKCHGPNEAEAQAILNWNQPRGLYSGFRITVTNNETSFTHERNTCNVGNCSDRIYKLKHYTEYSLTVETLSCGKPSTPVVLACKTGITDPVIPQNHSHFVKVTKIEHNTFSIKIEPSLLDNTNGPITHVGVLVTNNIKEVDTANMKQYLVKTYAEWSAESTAAYLATVTQIDLQSRSSSSELIFDIGDSTQWEGYTNGGLKDNVQYRYAIVLFTQLNVLPSGLVDDRTSLVSITSFYNDVHLKRDPGEPAVIAIAVGSTLGIFFVLSFILIGFIIYWRRLSIKESSDIQIQTMRSAAVRVEDFEVYYRKQKADSNCGFAEEFEDLKPVGTGQPKTSALAVENKPKNRYNNVLPYESSRVKLSIHGSHFDDYINANYMPGYNSRKEYIAAQGPLPCTVNEFWRMIWEKNVQTLVMLTRCNEQGRVKCEQYWPTGTKHFENITVMTTSEIPLEDWTIRDFDIKNVKTAETRSVRHFHFTAWPDHGVPETTELLINFRHLVREHMDQYSRHSPTMVHCSAGVGRTGTFIAIDRLIFQIERENTVDVYGIVHDLRMHRPLMVQTEDQFVFLNQCAMDIIRSRTGKNVDLIYQNPAALSIYENVQPRKALP